MKKNIFVLVGVLTIIFAGSFVVKASADTIPMQEVNRVYNPNTGEHLFTPSIFEESYLVDKGWKGEGNAFFIPNPPIEVLLNNRPSYIGPSIQRLYNPNVGEHFYTASSYEASVLVSKGWKRDLITILTATEKVGVPVYRLYNPNAIVGSHHFTENTYERDSLVQHGWRYEGVAFYALPNP
ncbi:hypothetical protein [Lactococcus taiwanensis]|uniref:hypothetical protein n=1 Tax=Lactococcus taiwanensis TaxID=1151742 RepID=UPI0035155F1F